jgi:ABC-type branched-subunit amino acid transport system substrate-binding protein
MRRHEGMKESMRRKRIATPLVLIAVLAAGCANHNDSSASAGGETRGGNNGATETTAAAKPGVFGTLAEPVCGPGSGGAASAQGVTADTIKIGVAGDANNTIVPDVNKELYDTSQAFVAWCNEAGGINGRKIEMTKRDAGLLKVREALTDACAQDFALVGGGFALDSTGVSTRVGCGLLEIPGFVNSSDARETPKQVQAIPFYKTQWPVTQYAQIAKAYPDAISHFGLMLSAASLDSARPQDVRLMEAITPLGYKMADKIDLPPPTTPIDNWRPYVEELKSKGVRVLDFEVTPELLVPLLKSMRDVNWYPDAIVLPGNFYNQALLDAGDALKNVYINTYITPFEMADKNPSTKQFMEIMDKGAPEWKHAALAVNSFSSWLLFAKAAKACGANLTRECVEQNALNVGTWDGGGLHVAMPNNTKTNPVPKYCGALLSATADGFKIDEKLTAATDGIYNCSPKNTATVPL